MVSLVSRGEWLERRLHQQGLEDEEGGNGDIMSARLGKIYTYIPFLLSCIHAVLSFLCLSPYTVQDKKFT